MDKLSQIEAEIFRLYLKADDDNTKSRELARRAYEINNKITKLLNERRWLLDNQEKENNNG